MDFYLLALFIVYSVLFIFSVYKYRFNLVSPSVIFNASFAGMLLLANIFDWYFNFNITVNTFRIFTIAGLIFNCVEYFIFYKKYSFNNGHTEGTTGQHYPIVPSKIVIYCFLALMIVSLGLTLVSIFSRFEGNSWNEIMNAYNLSRHRIETNNFSFIISQLVKLMDAFMYLYSAILIYNFIIHHISIVHNKLFILLNVLYIFLILIFYAGRIPLIQFISFIFFISIFFYLKFLPDKKIKIQKLLIRLTSFACLVTFVFIISVRFVGRRIGIRNIITYVAFYLCGGFYNFNNNLVPFSTEYFGQSTFCDIYAFLADKLKLFPKSLVLNFNAIYPVGIDGYPANATTIFGRWYLDFGEIGVYIMTSIIALIFCTIFYRKILKNLNFSIWIILYFRFLFFIVLASYDDLVHSLFSVKTIIDIGFTFLLYRFIVEQKHKIDFKGMKSRFKKVIH